MLSRKSLDNKDTRVKTMLKLCYWALFIKGNIDTIDDESNHSLNKI